MHYAIHGFVGRLKTARVPTYAYTYIYIYIYTPALRTHVSRAYSWVEIVSSKYTHSSIKSILCIVCRVNHVGCSMGTRVSSNPWLRQFWTSVAEQNFSVTRRVEASISYMNPKNAAKVLLFCFNLQVPAVCLCEVPFNLTSSYCVKVALILCESHSNAV